MQRQTVATMTARSARHGRVPTAASVVAVVSVLALVGCAPDPAPERVEPPMAAADASEIANAAACGELAALSATVLRLGVDATGSEAQAVVDAASDALRAMTTTGSDSIGDAFTEAQQRASAGMSVNDFISALEGAVLACDAAGLTIEYRMPGG